MGKRRRAARCMVDNSHIPQDWYKAEQSRCSGINYCRFSRTWDICLANERKTVLQNPNKRTEPLTASMGNENCPTRSARAANDRFYTHGRNALYGWKRLYRDTRTI